MSERYTLVEESGKLLKFWDNKTKTMYRVVDIDAYETPGSLEQHLRFHPEATPRGTNTLPVQTVSKIEEVLQ